MQSNEIALADFFRKHQDKIESDYPGINSEILLAAYLKYSNSRRSDYFLDCNNLFFTKILEGQPLEYITNSKFFYRSDFYVDERVLIPRSETEILVEDSVKFLNSSKSNKLKVAEVGVGSFALGLSILSDLDRPVDFTGGDISKAALEVAQINLYRQRFKLLPQNTANLIVSDRLEGFNSEYDLIVSNPPYIKRSQESFVHDQVLEFEPDISLFLDDEEHDEWFLTFFEDAYKKLKVGGAFFMEGHEDNLTFQKEIAEKIFDRVDLKRDYTNRLRFLYCYKES